MLPPIHQPKTQAPANPYAKGPRAPAPKPEPIDVIDLAPIDPVDPLPSVRASMHRPLVEPPPPPKHRRFIDKVATFCVQAVCVLILVAIVIVVAGVGVPLGGGWVLHSVWIALIAGFVIALPLEFVLRRSLGALGLDIPPLLAKKS